MSGVFVLFGDIYKHMKKICNLCGRGYNAHRQSQSFCSKQCSGKNYKSRHERENRKCLVCDTEFEVIKTSNRIKKCCSVECANRYFSKKFSGSGNPNFGKVHAGMYKHTKEEKEKIKTAVTNHWKTEGRKNKHILARERYKSIHGFYPMSSPEALDKISAAISSRMLSDPSLSWVNSKRGYYTSTKTGNKEYYQSSYEKNKMIEFDNDELVKYWTKSHKIVIKYRERNRYHPDFFVEYKTGKKSIIEIKGYIKDVDKFIDKSKMALKYCNENNIEYVILFPNKRNFICHGHLLKIIYEKI